MKKYLKDRQCIKCGEIGSDTCYQKELYVERIFRRCNNCGYTWYEVPLDAEKFEKEENIDVAKEFDLEESREKTKQLLKGEISPNKKWDTEEEYKPKSHPLTP